MINLYKHQNVTWVDLESPTADEVRQVVEEYGIDPALIEDIHSPIPYSRVECAGDTIYFVLDFPVFKHTRREELSQEVKFYITPEALITVRYETIDAIHKFSKEFEVASILNRTQVGTHVGHLLFLLIRKLYRSVFHELAYIEDSLKETELQIFEGKEREMVEEISNISRTLLNFKQILAAHADIIRGLSHVHRQTCHEGIETWVDPILSEHNRIHIRITQHADSLRELRKTNDSLLTTKQNEVMKILTIMAFITFPLTLITSMFGMNTITTPIVGSAFDFWKVIAIMIFAVVIFFVYFKHKKWL